MATKEALALFANDPIMLGRSIRSFGHLECQNPSIISESIGILNGGKKWEKSEEESEESERRNLIRIEEDIEEDVLWRKAPLILEVISSVSYQINSKKQY